jgi:hypothetical protein
VAIDTSVRGSPGWQLERLAKRLRDPKRQAKFDTLDAWSRGEPPLPKGAESARAAYQAFQRFARSNFAGLVVAAPLERMRIVGVRTSADSDETGDAAANELYVRAGLPIESTEAHRMMLTLSRSYVIVGPPDADGVPVVTAEDPRQVITQHDPVQQRRVLAGLKMFHDDDAERDLAYLYLPGRVHVAYRDTKRPLLSPSMRAWFWDPDKGGEAGQELDKLGDTVPVVRLLNERGVGEFETHLDLLHRINHMILQRMVIAAMQAFRQRVVKGLPTVYPAGHPKAGQEIDYSGQMAADPGTVWMIPGVADIWESGQVDLTPILSSVRDDVKHLAAVTRTPMHMLDPSTENQTAEGAALTREGLVFRVQDRIARVEPGWSRVMSLMFRWLGDEKRANLTQLRMMWAPAQSYSLSERLAAAAQARGTVPLKGIWSDVMGLDPDTIARYEAWRADELLLEQTIAARQAADGQRG